MNNRQIQIARNYHEETKHSLERLQSNRHGLDWDNEPLPFKIYPDLEPIPLPKDLPSSGKDVFESIERVRGPSGGEKSQRKISILDELAYLLYYTAGVTKKMDIPGRKLFFRAPASAGALYPVEVYLVCRDIPGLSAGVYHFSPKDFSLRRLREGDYRQVLIDASGDDQAVREAPAVLIFTGITWRTAWKYQARSYRYHYWDCGVMLANALVSSGAMDLPSKVIMGFVDEVVDRLVGIDGEQEKSLCLFPVGMDSDSLGGEDRERGIEHPLPPLDLKAVPLSSSQVDYPIIQTLHNASRLQDAAEVKSYKTPLSLSREEKGDAQGKGGVQLEPLPAERRPYRPLEEVIVKRGSSRRFKRDAISFYVLSSILSLVSADLPADWLEPGKGTLNRVYLSIHAVEELEPGAYVFHPQNRTLQGLKKGNFRGDSATICLGQDLGGDASAAVYFLADLEAVLKHFGNRGYRVAQMEAGILGGLLYLGAYALNRGASGLTFFDDMMVDFFTPHSSGLDAIFVVVLGAPEKRGGMGGRVRRISPGEKVSLQD
jgi:SagB-type dehydrogenase family enzyme